MLFVIIRKISYIDMFTQVINQTTSDRLPVSTNDNDTLQLFPDVDINDKIKRKTTNCNLGCMEMELVSSKNGLSYVVKQQILTEDEIRCGYTMQSTSTMPAFTMKGMSFGDPNTGSYTVIYVKNKEKELVRTYRYNR